MSGAYAQARMDRSIFSKPRKALNAPVRPLAIREDYLTSQKTDLIISPKGDTHSANAFKIEDKESGHMLFTASGWKYNGRSCREFRDASGLPLFELHRRILSVRAAWAITLPGSSEAELATGMPRFSSPAFGNFSISFANVAARDVKGAGDEEVTLVVERHGRVLQSFDIIDGGDRKVAEVRESIHHNEKLALLNGSRRNHRPVLDAVVTAGVDLSLVAVIAIIASDSVFGVE